MSDGDPGHQRRLEIARALATATGTPLTVVGEIEAGTPDITWIGPDGAPAPPRRGYEHFGG